MSKFLATLKRERSTVEVAVGGLDWRVRAPSPLQVLEAGAKALPRIEAPPRLEDEPDASQVSESPAERLARLQAQQAGARDLQALVCAAVVGVRPPGGEWEPCTLVLDLSDEADETMWVGSLPPSVQVEILVAAMAAQGGAFDRVIATFQSGS